MAGLVVGIEVAGDPGVGLAAADSSVHRRRLLIFSMAGPNLDIAPIVANNGADPVLELEAGRTHRVRIINITADDLVEMEIHDSAGLIPWRILAFDGADVPPSSTLPADRKRPRCPGSATRRSQRTLGIVFRAGERVVFLTVNPSVTNQVEVARDLARIALGRL